jgi:hypothetical protein
MITGTTNWEQLKDVIDARRQGYKNITDVVNYQSNHDHDRLLVELGKKKFPIDPSKKSICLCFESKNIQKISFDNNFACIIDCKKIPFRRYSFA